MGEVKQINRLIDCGKRKISRNSRRRARVMREGSEREGAMNTHCEHEMLEIKIS